MAQLLAVKPQDSFHVLEMSDDSRVTGLTPVADMSMRINGGYFVLRRGIFDYLHEGEDLVMDGCRRAAADGRMRAVQYDGFWAPMDTLKERTTLEDQYRRGISPWALGVRDVCKNVGPSCSSQRSIRRFSEEDSLRATGGVAGQSDQGGPRWQGVGSARRTKRGPSKSSTLSPRSLASVQISSIPWGMVHWGSNAGIWLLILVKSTW